MNLRITSLIYLIGFTAGAFGLYMVKFSVENLQREVKTAEVQLANEKESLHLLNAEWAYLNRPERLRNLAEEHLALVPLDSRRIQNASLLQDAAPSSLYQPVSVEAR
jgi:hypothetical protein